MKRLFTLLIACCLICLTGCGEKKTENTDLPQAPIPILTEKQMKGVKIEDRRTAENFKLVCEQIGVVPDEITSMKKSEGWSGGDSYTFAYAGTEWSVYCNRDSTIEAILIDDTFDIFNKNTGAYHINDYVVTDLSKLQTESMAPDILKEHLALSETDVLNITEFQIGRVNNLYDVYGSASVLSEGKEERVINFYMCFEYIDFFQRFDLCVLQVDDNEMLNKIESVQPQERTPAVKQK